MNRNWFWDACNHWKKRSVHEKELEDIYDGRVWKEFESNFFSGRNNLGFMLNVDWFQPYKHSTYSLGVIYLVILNFPRNIRYKLENSIIIGFIPGPHEPSGNINTYLGPLVQELLELWHGSWVGGGSRQRYVRGALLAVSSDVPACRKIGGFVGHSAAIGCSKCTKEFPTAVFGEKADYGGYDVDQWPERDSNTHKDYGYQHLTTQTMSAQKDIERKYGARYSILYELPYYDPVRFVIIDPMHCLFLGIAKHTYKVCSEIGILSDSDKESIQSRVDRLVTPSSIGRIPLEIASGFASLTADQWRNWTCVYSLYALNGLLPAEHRAYWWLFVKGCRLLCRRTINTAQCKAAHSALVEFCKLFEQVNGKQRLVINMHLSCHLLPW